MSKNAISKQSRIGKSIRIVDGSLECNEDLILECNIKTAKIDVQGNTLVINADCTVEADIFADTVIIIGNYNGTITATTQVDIQSGAKVTADMTSKQFKIDPDSVFQGRLIYAS